MSSRKVGRPQLREEDRQKYQRIAIYPSTYIRLKSLAQVKNITHIKLLDDLINKEL